MKNIETLNTIASLFGDIAAAAEDGRTSDTSILTHRALMAAEEMEGIDNRRNLVQLAVRVQNTAREEPEELAAYAAYARGHIIRDLLPDLQNAPL